MINIVTAFENKVSAKKVGQSLLKERLVACVNMMPIGSLFWWKEEIVETDEVFLLCKTVDGNFTKVKEFIEERHEYEVPLIEAWKVDHLNKSYERFVEEETRRIK